MKSGFLWMHSRVKTTDTQWDGRWLVSKGANVLIYMNKTDVAPIGNIQKACIVKIAADECEESPVSSNEELSIDNSALNHEIKEQIFSFTVHVVGRGAAANHAKKVVFAALSENEREAWIASFKEMEDEKQISIRPKPNVAKFAKKESAIAVIMAPMKALRVSLKDIQQASSFIQMEEPDFDDIISKAVEKSLEDLKSLQQQSLEEASVYETEGDHEDEPVSETAAEETEHVTVEEPIVEIKEAETTQIQAVDQTFVPQEDFDFKPVPIVKKLRAVFKYTPRTASELSISPGDTITTTLTSEDESYLCGVLDDGRKGWFPAMIAEQVEF